jgi:RNA polymerase sigma-70 factor (ECF subfamily)
VSTDPDPKGLSDANAFARAYRENADRVRASAMRVLKDPGRAEDVAQEVFERLWLDPARYDPSRGDLGPYLQLVARSRALDAWRADGAAGRATERLGRVAGRDEAPEHEQPASAAEHGELHRAVIHAVRGLPEAQREAIVFAYWGGMSSAEIARRMGIPLGTAKSRLRLAHEKLRDAWPVADEAAAGELEAA